MTSHYPQRRPRRLRVNATMRDFVAETTLQPADLTYPLFIAHGLSQPREISSMPGQYQHTMDSLREVVGQAIECGIRCIDLFGVPDEGNKDARGTEASDPDGILNRAISVLRQEYGDDILIMADTCLDEFTDHGHCGVLTENQWGEMIVDNDATLLRYKDMAVSQARAGAHIISPSGMMDGQIRAIREGLDEAGYHDVAIMAYSAKYASAFFGPFREAVGSSLVGDRRAYQQDPANARESLLEVDLDIAEGADFVMVKPAMSYLDIVRQVADRSPIPVAAYQVSGEYAMLHAAASNGWLDLDAVMMESLLSIKRAGAEQILTYFALDAAKKLRNF
ncbi:porphobilinogen synthase [Corynebacterium sp. ES2715-CONJ3]|uniref:porphobilinogen synthase n=1 Tax=Corynebacterium sp. ES2715-CONJ3 TaxID=2974028 RepID=UPI00216A0797|nr:porphobilinogen synthase [Corynebacterium sp. ES2715-CONJ3]MCS4491273.1 porphobilinogen synthase [Corynebacterium sp. ES2715-CONJ3]